MLYIVTAVHNRFTITQKFVKQLKEQIYQDFRLILVDDGCTDHTVSMVKKDLPNSIILHGDGNLYWGGALHKAFLWLTSYAKDEDYVMFANDDTTFDKEYLKKAVAFIKSHRDCLLTGCGFSSNTGKQIDGVVHWDFRTGKTGINFIENDEGNCASTRSLFFSIKVMKKMGGFHPILLPHYASDYEWTLRSTKNGYRIISTSLIRYFFDEGTTGDNELNTLNLQKLFSKRSNRNPLYRLNLVLLSTPFKYLPCHLIYQLKRYIKRSSQFVEIVRR